MPLKDIADYLDFDRFIMRIFTLTCVCGLRCQRIRLFSVKKWPVQNLVYSNIGRIGGGNC